MSIQEFDARYLGQNGKCAICRTSFEGGDVKVDHCHINGHIRGLLCGKCNQGLGLFGDDAVRLQRAINYLAQREMDAHDMNFEAA